MSGGDEKTAIAIVNMTVIEIEIVTVIARRHIALTAATLRGAAIPNERSLLPPKIRHPHQPLPWMRSHWKSSLCRCC